MSDADQNCSSSFSSPNRKAPPSTIVNNGAKDASSSSGVPSSLPRQPNQNNSQRKYVTILPRRRSDDPARNQHQDCSTSASEIQVIGSGVKQEECFQQVSSLNNSFFVFRSPIVEQHPFSSYRHSFGGSFELMKSDRQHQQQNQQGKESYWPAISSSLNCSDKKNASTNNLKELKILELKASPSATNTQELGNSEQMEVEKNQDQMCDKSKETANVENAKKSGKHEKASHRVSDGRKHRKRNVVANLEEEIEVRRSKRKVNPPNFFVTNGSSNSNRSDEKEEKSSESDYQRNQQQSTMKSPAMSLGNSPRRTIRVGSCFQADVVSLAAFSVPPSRSAANDGEDDLDECVWQPEQWQFNDSRFMEEFCHVARRHQKLQVDEALEALFMNDYSIADALMRLEEFNPRRNVVEWSSEEIEVFNKQLSRGGKRFHLVAKNLPNKTLSNVVEFYYRTKKMRCYLTSSIYMSCPFIENRSMVEPPITPRNECQNCLKDLGRNPGVKADNRGKKKVPVCPACELYAKLTKRYRPFTTSLQQQQKSIGSGIKPRSMASPERKDPSPALSTHPHCFFEPRMSSLIRETSWTLEQISTCVKAFRKHGNDFKAIAGEVVGKDAYDVASFYIPLYPLG